ILAKLEAEAKGAADGLAVIGLEGRRSGLLVGQVNTERDAVVEDIGLDEGERGTLRILAELTRNTGKLALAEQVALLDAHLTDDAVRGRIPARDRELTGGLLLDIDIDNDAVGRGPRLVGDLDGLEELQVLQPSLGAVDQRTVVRVAFSEVEFAT